MSPLAAAFEDGPAFIPYLVAGDPDTAATAAYVDALDAAGADAIELGLPHSEPIAEGPTIQAAIDRSLTAGMTPPQYLDLVASLSVDVPLVCMTYYNLLVQYGATAGPRPFVEDAVAAGIDGFVIPDLPVEESDPMVAACEAAGCDLVFIVAPTTTAERRGSIRELASGFVYVQARLGTTGARSTVAEATRRSLDRLDDWSIPTAVGFGIASGSTARTVVEAGADGAIVGSALVETIEAGHADGRPPAQVADDLVEQAAEIATGVHGADTDLDPRVVDILAATRRRTPPRDRLDVQARPLVDAIERTTATGRVPVIAELKRTSPTADHEITADAATVASRLVDGGATAISVLTEPEHFGGSAADLESVRSAVDVPVVRKDFVLDAAELDRVAADAVLLIARFLDDLEAMVDEVRRRGMEPLVEVHTPAELDRAVSAGATLLGINNRDLGSLTVDRSTVERLAPLAGDGTTVIAESGVRSPADARRMLDAGAEGVLVGSAIMTGDMTETTASLAEATRR